MKEIKEAASYLLSQGIEHTKIGIVLGTGLGNLATRIDVIKEISYQEIPHFPISTVETHSGKLIYGSILGKKVLAMQGRFHLYEGYSMQQIAMPVRVMKLLGVETLLLSNAAGSINLNWKKGDLMLIDDHINLQVSNPLIGKNLDELGPRFPDMSEPYNNLLNEKLKEIAHQKNIILHQGVYASVQGPMLETKAEYRYLKSIGADAVGMSTVPEVIAAVHCGIKCAAVSVLTDECDPDNLKPVNIAEIITIAGQAELKLSELLIELIAQI